MINKTSIVDKVKSQFPEFYTEYGPSFIDFMQVYYAWMEENLYTGPTKDLPSLLDIDETTSLFLNFFKKEYMNGLPERIVGNQRFLQKHILDLYRAKGSEEGLRLLFRLLYNKEIDIYIPGKDIFKPSHGKWLRRKYIEISDSDLSPTFEGMTIYGEISRASAMVESYDRINYNGIINHVLWLSSIEGNFLVNERVSTNLNDMTDTPRILGSAVGFEPLNSHINFSLGDTITYSADTNLKFNVQELNAIELNGIIVPTVLKVGEGYREGQITSDYVLRGANGTGAEVGYYLRPGGVYHDMTDELIIAYANTNLNAADYLMPSADVDDINSVIADALLFVNTEFNELYGSYTIAGSGYDDVVDIYPTDEDVLRLELRTADDTLYGNNAIVEGYPAFGTDRISTVNIINSSFNYREPIFLTLNVGEKEVYGQLVIGAVGIAEGYYSDTNGFVSADKYLQDSYYYQEYSYDIRIDELFDKYFSVLLKTIHPTGKKAFGNARIISTYELAPSIETIFEEVT
jgi:hypothetical protein